MRARISRWLEQWLIRHGILATPEQDERFSRVEDDFDRLGY